MPSNAPILPLELFLHIAEHCTRLELLSLVQVNRSCHDGILPILYRIIPLTNYDVTFMFCRTICDGPEHLPYYPLVIEIDLCGEPDDQLRENEETEDLDKRLAVAHKQDEMLGNVVADTLALTVNLVHLSLQSWREQVFDPIFALDRLPYSFMLRRLCIQALAQEGFGKFLEQQRCVEELHLAWSWEGDSREFRESGRYNLAFEALPALRNLCIETPPLVGLRLMKNSPVTTLRLKINSHYCENLELGLLLQQGSVPLTSLRVSTWGFPGTINKRLPRLLQTIRFCRYSLRDLTIVVSEGYDEQSTLKAERMTDLDSVKSSLQGFDTLEAFALMNQWDDETPSLEMDFDIHSCIQQTLSPSPLEPLWKESCPNLKRLFLYRPIFSI
ncbi:hypothetical protein FRC09_017401 [Ceratobasidium sp. 395]|nr:hypothetical protein FRC09_017401 [Ceratobasidium sp. 395]